MGARLAVYGATGQVGTVMRQILRDREFPADSIRFLASPRSAGKRLPWTDGEIEVEDAWTADHSGVDIALFSIGATASKELAGRVTAAGATVVDNSSAFRMDPNSPLVVAGVNDHAIDSIPSGVVANPNCTTMAAMPVLKPLHEAARLKRLVISTYQAVSGAGTSGPPELLEQTLAAGEKAAELTFDGEAIQFPAPQQFPTTIAYNVIPMSGPLGENDETSE